MAYRKSIILPLHNTHTFVDFSLVTVMNTITNLCNSLWALGCDYKSNLQQSILSENRLRPLLLKPTKGSKLHRLFLLSSAKEINKEALQRSISINDDTFKY